jgi:competence protein ComEC
MDKHYTRFRAYQLGEKGASFSLSVDNYFVLIEARYNNVNKEHIKWEMQLAGVTSIDVLHITSWDEDHCKLNELNDILTELRPRRIEYPGYMPHTDNGRACLLQISSYGAAHVKITPELVKGQEFTRLCGRDLFFGPLDVSDSINSNDKSTIKLFRIGSFQILSLGDCESEDIANKLITSGIIINEVDLLILAHHGANNGFTSIDFLRAVNPRIAICACDWDNQYDHPDATVRSMLSYLNIPLITTKAGDVIAQSIDKYSFKVSNYISSNEKKESVKEFRNKTWFID